MCGGYAETRAREAEEARQARLERQAETRARRKAEKALVVAAHKQADEAQAAYNSGN